MIESIKLNGFQKHKSLDLEFNRGLNVIIGDTDAGKSSIYRALRFVIANQHKRTNIVNHDLKHAEVELSINSHSVIRRKGKGINEYEIDGSVLKAFGAGCPEEVARACSMSELNWSPQHGPDALFLISDTSGNISKRVNEMISLDLIDKSVKYVGSRRDKAKREAEDLALSMSGIEASIEEYDWLGSALKEIEEIKSMSDRRCALQLKHDKLGSSLENLLLAEMRLSEYSFVEEATEDLRNIEELKSSMEDFEHDVSRIEGLIKSIDSYDPDKYSKEIEMMTKQIEELQDKCPTCGQPIEVK